MGMLGDHSVVNGGLCKTAHFDGLHPRPSSLDSLRVFFTDTATSLAQYAVTIAASFASGSRHAGLERKIIQRRRGDDFE
jgi:hypothetical protein